MESVITNKDYEKYLIYPNETIDRLTVNRTFNRMFNDIESKSGTATLQLEDATDSSYGKAKFSVSGTYSFDRPVPTDDSYDNSMLTIGQLYDMSKRISDGDSDSLFSSPASSESLSGIRYWIRSNYASSRFVFMPNGVNVYTYGFDVGFDGISNVLGPDAIESDVVKPVVVDSYSDTINVDRSSYLNIVDYANEKSDDSDEIMDIKNIDGIDVDVPFIVPMKTTLHHNKCPHTIYSAYKQSYVEVNMSARLSVVDMFREKYDSAIYRIVGEDGSERNMSEPSRYRLFTQRPMVMAQICFYNNESNPTPLFGYDNRYDGIGRDSSFPSYNRLSQKPLDEVDSDGVLISPVNGSVFVKKFENIYDSNGSIIDNVIHFDIVFKFMAGSASDPEMEYAMNLLNSRSRVQIAMIGV